jgi:tetratricopeptide (TPR) repeat protein
LILALWALGGCGGADVIMPPIDTPSQHVQTGYRMLEMNKLNAAYREFERSLDLDGKYAPALVGVAQVHARRNELHQGLRALAEARRYARGKDQEMEVHVGVMRFYLSGRHYFDEDWLLRVKQAFQEAVDTDQNDPVPHYYMGQAYREARQFDLAARHFYRVVEAAGAFSAEAAREYRAAEEMATPTAQPEASKGGSP